MSDEASPGFVDAAALDLHLQASSPAIDSGTFAQAFAIFRSLYGLDSAVDAEGAPRPQGAAWDIGALER